MRIGIGIDTGGTYTDAVLYDFETKSIIAKNKSLTTKEDLSIGIKKAIETLPRNLVESATILSVSTTLATNACVENKGGRAKLLLIGTSKETLQWIDAKNSYGLQNDTTYCIENFSLNEKETFDYYPVLEESIVWLQDAQAIAVVAKNAVYDGAIIEKKIKNTIKQRYNTPLIMANEVANNINMLERGATALLNARLLSIVEEFVDAIALALHDYNVSLKKMIVRSDGSLMANDLILTYPVKTILSGPAASVIGAMGLVDCQDSLIIDMGGTTTDISIVKNGKPAMTQGITIGGYRTQVQGVLIDTFPLGGDTRIIIRDGLLYLDNRRVMPLCALAKKYPQIKLDLERIISHNRLCGFMFHEFLYLVKEPKKLDLYDAQEIEIINSLIKGPVSLSGENRDMYVSKVTRLETEGIVMRAGLTPTDFMHIKGDFLRYDKDASTLGATYLLKILPQYQKDDDGLERLSNDIYNLVCKTLYMNIIKTVCAYQSPLLFKNGFDQQFLSMLEKNWDERNKINLVSSIFKVNATLIGIGAPIHIFLKEVADICGTTYCVPEHAEVANALGAIIADISAESRAKVSPIMEVGGLKGYLLQSELGLQTFDTKEEALDSAKTICEKFASTEAKKRGAFGELSVNFDFNEKVSSSRIGESIDLGVEVVCSVAGRV